MERKKLVFSVITLILFFILVSQIKVHRQEVGKEVDYDKTWEQTAAVFPVLELCPKFTDRVDYWEWHKRESNGYMGLDIGLREVKDAEKKALDIQKAFENAGFEVYETEIDDPKSDRPYETVKHYVRLRKNLDDSGNKKLTIRIEWFELEYKHSHNIYIQIFP